MATSSRSPGSGRSGASWCGHGLPGALPFTGRPSDGAGSSPCRLLHHCSIWKANWQFFSMSNCPGETWILLFILFQETSVVWSGRRSAEMSCLRHEESCGTDIPHPQFGLLGECGSHGDGVGTHSALPSRLCQPAVRGREAAQEELNHSGATENTGLAGPKP